MPHRVLQLISTQGCYGAERMLLTLASGLEAEGRSCIVAVFRDPRRPAPELLAEARRLGLTASEIPCRGRFDPAAVRALRSQLMNRTIDILHCHGYKADCYARFCDRPARVATCHNWPDPRLRMRAYAALDRMALRSFAGVAAVSPTVAARLRASGLPASRVCLIPNGIDFAPAPPAPDLAAPGAGPLVGFAGRLAAEKGILDLLHAARIVAAREPGVRFAIAGDGPLRGDAEHLADALGLSGNVRFLGRRSDIAACYAAFDVLALPSRDEGLPLTLLEAMAAGVPAVATRVGFVPHAVTDGVTGLLVAPASPAALAEALLSLLARPAWARELGQAARARALTEFSARAMTHAYLDLYACARSDQ